ncbi:MAG: hypothetical protein Kow0088_12890 [Anaerolineales bacterium]
MKKLLRLNVLLILPLLGCNFLTSLYRSGSVVPTADRGATQAASAESIPQTLTAAQQYPSPLPQVGSIRGNLSFPGETIPPLRVVAINLATHAATFIDTAENQTSYQLENLPPGKYIVIAYTRDGSLAGGYTQMVPCGLLVECTDHSLIPVVVFPGKVTSAIDPADWYAPSNAFPPNPFP